jgi:hypothetical protein
MEKILIYSFITGIVLGFGWVIYRGLCEIADQDNL